MQILCLILAIGAPVLFLLAGLCFCMMMEGGNDQEPVKFFGGCFGVIFWYLWGMVSAYAAVSILLDELKAAGVMW